MLLKKAFAILAMLSPLSFFACAEGRYSCFRNWDHMMGYGYGGGFMWLKPWF